MHDIGEHRPGERGGGREDQRALDHEDDGQEQGEQAGNADDDALVERQAVDAVLVGVAVPTDRAAAGSASAVPPRR